MLPARFVIVGENDYVPVPEVIRPFRVQMAAAGPARIAGCHESPRFQGVNVFLAFHKIDGFGLKHARQAIRDTLDTIQIPDIAAAPIGSALPKVFLTIGLQVADRVVEKDSVRVHVGVALNLPQPARAVWFGGFCSYPAGPISVRSGAVAPVFGFDAPHQSEDLGLPRWEVPAI